MLGRKWPLFFCQSPSTSEGVGGCLPSGAFNVICIRPSMNVDPVAFAASITPLASFSTDPRGVTSTAKNGLPLYIPCSKPSFFFSSRPRNKTSGNVIAELYSLIISSSDFSNGFSPINGLTSLCATYASCVGSFANGARSLKRRKEVLGWTSALVMKS